MKQSLTRDFWLFWLGQFVSNLGSSFTAFALPLLVYRLTGSALNLAISSAVTVLPYVLFGLPIGVWIDRAYRKRLMIGADIGRGLIIALVPLLARAEHLSVLWIYAVAFVNSTLAIGFSAGEYAALPSLVGRDEVVAANGKIQASYAMASVAGPFLAGALVAVLPIETVLYVDAGSFLFSAITLRLVRCSFNAEQAEEHASQGIIASIKEGIRYELSQPLLRNISLMLVLVNFVISPIAAQLVYFAKNRLAASDSQWAWMAAAGGLGIIALSLAASWLRRRLSFSTIAVTTLCMYGLLTLMLASTTSYWLALALWATMSGLGTLFDISVISLRQQVIPDALLGRVMISAALIVEISTPLGSMLGGLLIQATQNVALVFAISGILVAVIPLVFLRPLARAERDRSAKV